MASQGTPLEFASLTFQVFSGCIKGYQLLSDARGMPNEFQYLRVAIKTEESRLLNWAHVAKLDEQEDTLLIAQANKQTLLDVLEEQKKLLTRFGRYDERYKPLKRQLIKEDSSKVSTTPSRVNTINSLSSRVNTINTIDENGTDEGQPAPGTLQRHESTFQNRFPRSEKLLQKALQCVKNTQKYPAGLQWAVFDNAAVETLVHRLKAMNDYMESLLTVQQMGELLERQKRTEYQMMQLNDKFDQLLQIVESGTAFGAAHRVRISANPFQAFLHSRGMLPSSTNHGEQSSQERLGALAKTKALISAIDSNSLTDPIAKDLSLGQSADQIKSVELDRKNIKIIGREEDLAETERVEAYYYNNAKRKQQVWIEWKSYDPQSFNGNPDPMILERLRALTTLLKENKHSDVKFRAPHCLGYFRDWDPATNEDACRFGLVFETPEGISSRKKPISLLEILRDTQKAMPSLTSRIALCHSLSEIVEKLHAVDWVHKGLRSHNVIFFKNDDADGDGDGDDWESINFSQPYISGFDYSRPAQNEELTEKPPENAAYDIYRHPRVHGSAIPRDPSSPYKKSYDIYSLGIILLEIAYWKPIDMVLGIDLANARPSITIKVKQRLTDEKRLLGDVKGNLGDKVFGVVKACLSGVEAFGLRKDDDERVPTVKEELQVGYYAVVVRTLGEVKV